MKCPFRMITKYEYVDLGHEKISVDTIVNDYAECYQDECPCYEWSVDKGYHCVQVDERSDYDD